MKKNNHYHGITTFALALLITGAIDNIRNLPATALFGSSLIFFFIFSAIVFLIPAALVSADLSANSTDNNGGIYHWVRSAFGEKVALLAVWLQWINTMVWFPTILSFIAGTITYLFDPALAQNKFYLIAVILTTFWLMTVINLKGIHTSTKFANFCSFFGMVIPMLLIIAMAIIWVILGKPLQIDFSLNQLIPSFALSDNWIALTAIMTSFLGMELATVHIKEVYHPQKTFPKALGISVLFILTTMIMGSLAIAIVLPPGEINLVAGIMQAFSSFFAAYHMSWLVPILTIMIVMGSLGNMTSWIISPAKGLLQAAESGYLPMLITQKNRHGIAHALLIIQAILVSFICLAFLLMPSVNGSYWLLSALSTQLYMLMYVLMFVAAIMLKYKLPRQKQVFAIPGGKMGAWLISLLGLLGCTITLFVGFIPPTSLGIGSILHYELMFVGGMITMILPITFLYWYKAKNQKRFAAKNLPIKETRTEY